LQWWDEEERERGIWREGSGSFPTRKPLS